MALNAYLKLKGAKQGDLKGGVTQKGREGQIEVNAVDHQINRSFDPASGVPADTRQHQPLVITKDVDSSTPQLYSALVTGEPLDFLLQFWQLTNAGTEAIYYTITLTGAQIVGIKNEMPNNNYPDLAKFNVREKVAFTYTKIVWTITTGAKTAEDSWSVA